LEETKINSYYKLLLVILFGFLAFSSFFCSNSCVFAQTDQTDSKLQAADTAVDQAFSALLEAEKAGANVTDLLVQLNNAADILAQAENSYRTGDINTAEAQADSILPIVQEITTIAQADKQTASVSSQNAFRSTIVFTLVGVFVFVLVLILFWLWFKRRYIRVHLKQNLR
jgi:CHASE3 domain sensor protein